MKPSDSDSHNESFPFHLRDISIDMVKTEKAWREVTWEEVSMIREKGLRP